MFLFLFEAAIADCGRSLAFVSQGIGCVIRCNFRRTISFVLHASSMHDASGTGLVQYADTLPLEMEVANQTFCLIQSDTGPTCPSTDSTRGRAATGMLVLKSLIEFSQDLNHRPQD